MNTKKQVIRGLYQGGMNRHCRIGKISQKLILLLFFGLSITKISASHASSYFICNDTLRPEISINAGTCEPAKRNVSNQICYGHLNLNATASDDQTPLNQLVFEYKIDLFNDGIGNYTGYDIKVGSLSMDEASMGIPPAFQDNPYADDNKSPFTGSGTYPIGIHKICWNVTDSCGNVASLCQLFEIVDCEAPKAYCLTGIITVPMPQSGCITIWAQDIDLGSVDNCTEKAKLRFYFDGDQTKISRTICCDDFLAAGANDELIVNSEMWVEDQEGNTDKCKVTINIQDIQNVCPSIEPGKATISERIYSIRNRLDTIPAKNVIINRQFGNIIISEPSAVDSFLIRNLASGKYTLSAEKNDKPFDSVSTYDMILMQEHILGKRSFDNVYQWYCADVNLSQTITASDISETRKLILRVIDNFRRVPAWFVFPVIDPVPMFPASSIIINVKEGEHRIIDFRAIKFGDVSDLIGSDSDKILIPKSTDTLHFNIFNKSIKGGDTLNVEVYSKNFTNILGYQYTIKFDTQTLKFIDIVENNFSNSRINNFGVRYVDSGFLTTCWFDSNSVAISYRPDEVLFTIKFVSKKAGKLCDLITINSDLTPAEAYRDSFILHNINLDVCDAVVATKETTSEICTVYPNPFGHEINFQFAESALFPVQIEFISMEGKRIEIQQLPNRVNSCTWNCDQIKNGVYLVGIRDGRNSRYVKMIKN